MRIVKLLFAASLFSLTFGASATTASTASSDFKECRQFFVGGQVPAFPKPEDWKARPLCFQSFAVLHSGLSKTPIYVVERLNRASLEAGKGLHRTNKFYEEARLPSAERSTLADYKGSEFDRGHNFPAGDATDENTMAQSFSLSNMFPQAPKLNRGVWAKAIESATRKYAMRAQGDVYVFTGPVFKTPAATIGPGKVWVPTYLYKLVYDASTGRAWAHWVENTDDAKAGKPITYQELVSRTGIDFLPGVNPKS